MEGWGDKKTGRDFFAIYIFPKTLDVAFSFSFFRSRVVSREPLLTFPKVHWQKKKMDDTFRSQDFYRNVPKKKIQKEIVFTYCILH